MREQDALLHRTRRDHWLHSPGRDSVHPCRRGGGATHYRPDTGLSLCVSTARSNGQHSFSKWRMVVFTSKNLLLRTPGEFASRPQHLDPSAPVNLIVAILPPLRVEHRKRSSRKRLILLLHPG